MFLRSKCRAFSTVVTLGGAFGFFSLPHGVGAAPPPPAVNGGPPPIVGDYAIRNGNTNLYLTAHAGTLTTSATLGANERFRIITPRMGMQEKRIQSVASSGFLTGAVAETESIKLLPSVGEEGLFDFKRDGGDGTWASAYRISPKGAPKRHMIAGPSAGGSVLLAEAGPGTNVFFVTKCGDIGSRLEYRLRPVGVTGPGTGGTMFTRQSDGTYSLGHKFFWSARGGGGNAPGKGSDGWPLDTLKETVGAYEKFKITDQGNCTYTIETAKGWFLGMKSGPWNWPSISTRISDPKAAPSIGYSAYWELMPDDL